MRIIISEIGGTRQASVKLNHKSGRYFDDVCFFKVNPNHGIIVDLILTKKDLKQIKKRFR